MLEKLFGNAIIEKILFYLLINDEAYSFELTKVFNVPLYSIQKALERLESGGILVSILKGKTRIYRFNPRCPFLKELRAFLKRAYAFLPTEQKSAYYEAPVRKRPRRKGKPL